MGPMGTLSWSAKARENAVNLYKPLPRVAYHDEFPWQRCPCGWVLNGDGGPCIGCGDIAEVVYRDRFAVEPTTDHGVVYAPVPYEDAYRRPS